MPSTQVHARRSEDLCVSLACLKEAMRYSRLQYDLARERYDEYRRARLVVPVGLLCAHGLIAAVLGWLTFGPLGALASVVLASIAPPLIVAALLNSSRSWPSFLKLRLRRIYGSALQVVISYKNFVFTPQPSIGSAVNAFHFTINEPSADSPCALWFKPERISIQRLDRKLDLADENLRSQGSMSFVK